MSSNPEDIASPDESSMTRRFLVLDCRISQINLERAADETCERILSGNGGYVCFSNVHTVVSAHKDLLLRDITNHSFLSLPDGKPLSLIAHWRGLTDVERVAGPDFLPHLIGKARGARHYFYGSTPDTLARLTENLREHFPDMIIAGSYSPPFRELTAEETDNILAHIKAAHPDLIWVGLGAPKQEYWISRHYENLRPAVLLGVGAAFEFHAGITSRAPAWMQRLSIEWLYRLLQEPRRLWKRYLLTNSLFIYYLARQALLPKSHSNHW